MSEKERRASAAVTAQAAINLSPVNQVGIEDGTTAGKKEKGAAEPAYRGRATREGTEGNPVIEIPIPGGVVRIDAADYELVKAYRWRRLRVHGSPGVLFHARTKINIDGKERCLTMHRLILGLRFGDPFRIE